MKADVGDLINVHGHTVGEHDRLGTVVEVRGEGGNPPFLVRFEDGHEALIFPGPDSTITKPTP